MTTSTPDALWASRSVRLLHPAAVWCEGLRRRAGGTRLLDGVDLAVPVGARLLLVSRPEASASMLLRILAGVARSDGGHVMLAGLSRADAGAAGWARRIGYVGPEVSIHGWLSPREALALAADLVEVAPAERQQLVEGALEHYDLAAAADQPIRRGGPSVAERVALAAAQLNQPEVLLLDEPLRAVDPLQRTRLMLGVGRRQTVIIASRYPSAEVGLVNRVVLLRDGRVALNAPVGDLEWAGRPLSLTAIEELASTSPGR